MSKIINEEARNYLYNCYYILKDSIKEDDNVYTSLKVMLTMNFNAQIKAMLEKIFGKENLDSNEIVWGMSYIVSLCDAYLDLSFKNSLYIISEEERNLFLKLISAIEDGTTVDFGSDDDIFKYLMDNSIRMYNAAALDKVEKFKSLNDEDLGTIDKINPFFKEEYDHFNVVIDENFIIRHVDKWFNHTNNLDNAYEYVATFINRIYYINPDELDDIMPKLEEIDDSIEDILFENDIDKLKDIIKAMYEAYENEKKNKTLN